MKHTNLCDYQVKKTEKTKLNNRIIDFSNKIHNTVAIHQSINSRMTKYSNYL